MRLRRGHAADGRVFGSDLSSGLGHDKSKFVDAMRRRVAATTWRALAANCGPGAVALAAVAASIVAAPGTPGILGAGLGALMVAVAVVDARHFIIPNVLTAAAFGLGLVNAGLPEGWQGIGMALLRGAVLALGFLAARAGYRWLRGRQGIGLGDVKLAAVGGVWLGWTVLPLAVEIAALAALAIYTLRWLRGRPVGRLTRVPFGLFFAPAIWLSWLVETTFVLG
jgi:leader peptidase (prepilin peptidase) / N-methyltransferase